MAKFRVWFSVHGTATAVIEAETEQEAREIAEGDYVESGIGICHQCSEEISDPTYGEICEIIEIED